MSEILVFAAGVSVATSIFLGVWIMCGGPPRWNPRWGRGPITPREVSSKDSGVPVPTVRTPSKGLERILQNRQKVLSMQQQIATRLREENQAIKNSEREALRDVLNRVEKPSRHVRHLGVGVVRPISNLANSKSVGSNPEDHVQHGTPTVIT